MRVLLILLGIVMSATQVGGEDRATVWFGTRGTHIYRAVLDLNSGELSQAEQAAEIQSPGFLTLNRDGTRLYSLGQAPGTGGNVAVFAIEEDQELTLLGTQNSGGGKATHVSLSHDEGTLLLAHYGGGSVAALPLDQDGKLLPPSVRIEHAGSSVNPDRQTKPHPHWIGPGPENRFVFVPDLGTDEVVIYQLDADAHRIQPHGAGKVPPGAGPRHLKFHPNGKWAYVLNELGLTVTMFAYDARQGRLDPVETVPAIDPADTKTSTSGSEIRMHPTGKFVYAGLRGEDVIAVFQVDESSGKLTLVEREPIRGSWPRNFGIDPTGRWLLAAGAESSTISVFRIDPESGRLFFTRQVIRVPNSICVEFQRHD